VENHELIRHITRLVDSYHASTLFLNGPPGAGKSYLLETLARDLPSIIQRCFVLGPYQIGKNGTNELIRRILTDCVEAGYLTADPPVNNLCDLVQTWKWLDENLMISMKQTLIVLVGIGNWDPENMEELCNLFSSARTLEGIWNSTGIRIHHLFSGTWDHPSMERFYDGINISFPYAVGHNYYVWQGISLGDMTTLVSDHICRDTRIPFGNILYELTGGHPGAALDIIGQIPANEFRFSTLLSATRQAAFVGSMSQELIHFWSQLPMESRKILKKMLLHRHIAETTLSPEMERLYIAGIIRKYQIGKEWYLDFLSWYVELVIHLHTDQLGITDETIQKVDIDELMPRVSIICIEAFRLINEIENLTRNFISIHLCLQSEAGFHYLIGRSQKFNSEKGREEDAYERAADFQNRSSDRGLPVELNPLIAYLSTRDLANLMEELGAKMQSTEWLRIAQAIRTLSDVRDAVMHNQLIDDTELDKLYQLQGDVYAALSK